MGIVARPAGGQRSQDSLDGVSSGTILPGLDGESRPTHWAQPVHAKSISNLHCIAMGVYRSGCLSPGAGGELSQLGIRTVINLQTGHRDSPYLAGTNIREIRLPMRSAEIDGEDLDQFLETIQKLQREGPVLFHCSAGADRSGVMAAAYRIGIEGWKPEAAIEEMMRGGYGFHLRYDHLPVLVLNWGRERMTEASSSVVE